MRHRLLTTLATVTVAGTLTLTACSSDDDSDSSQTDSSQSGHENHDEHGSTGTEDAESTDSHGSHGDMDDMDETDDMSDMGSADDMDHPADGGPPPEGITEASDPEFPVGTEVVLSADHMEGMDGATATISGAFDTNTYSVSYDPTDGSARVEDHKWVVQEELEDAGDERLADGDTATINADHMAGMNGAEATIDSSTDETVYMVDVEMDGMTMTNHKWVVESEMSPAE